MAAQRQDEIIEVLDCDFDVRPKGAPGVEQLLLNARGVSRVRGALVVEFDERAAQTLEAFVEAERLCCAGIGWEIGHSPSLRLRITASDEQLTAIESIWNGTV